jgi:hypothetical protein
MIKRALSILFLLFLLTSCDAFFPLQKISISIDDAGTISSQKVENGISIEKAISEAGIKLNPLDKVDPSQSTIISSPITIKITRVTEEYSVEESVLPFEQQTIKNESLAEGQKVLIQSGVNGKTQSIYRIVYENGVQVSRTFVSSETTIPASPEIVMIGVQSPYSVQNINGMIAYISSGNAWVMEANTGNRRVVTVSGNLDGRIFSLSYDRSWILYSTSNKSDTSKEINHLWIVSLNSDSPKPIDTGITNVVNYAEWVPGKVRTISYSTADISASPPFWNANNDLIVMRFDENGKTIEKKTLVDTNSGGLYGWWGTTYKWSPDAESIAYSRPDSIGLVNTATDSLEPIFQITPYQTESVWAWVADISWSSDSNFILAGLPDNSTSDPLDSTNLTVYNINTKQFFPLIENCGLFCSTASFSGYVDGKEYIAYLSAIIPDQSEISRYNLSIMDKDGSNQKKLYPGEGIQGLKAQTLFWEPLSAAKSEPRIAFISQGNLMFAEVETGAIKQITGDGSIEKIDWK